MYLSAAGSYVEVYLHGESKPLVFSMNLGYLSQFFMTHHFYRLSRSLVVNLTYLERIEKNQLFLTGRDIPLPFPESQHRSYCKSWPLSKPLKTLQRRDRIDYRIIILCRIGIGVFL